MPRMVETCAPRAQSIGRMPRTFLHLLLILGLILNGVLAPWAPSHAHANHASHAAHAPEAAAATHHAVHDHAAMLAAADAQTADAAATANAASGDDCCGGATCQCGCALPPAVPATVDIATSPQRAVAQDAACVTLVIVQRGSPPFRPPAA